MNKRGIYANHTALIISKTLDFNSLVVQFERVSILQLMFKTNYICFKTSITLTKSSDCPGREISPAVQAAAGIDRGRKDFPTRSTAKTDSRIVVILNRYLGVFGRFTGELGAHI